MCALLKNRAQEVRDIARSTLAKIIEDLGVHYLQYILKELQTTLVRGYQVTCITCCTFKFGWSFHTCSLSTKSRGFGSVFSTADALRQHQAESEVSNQYVKKLLYLIFVNIVGLGYITCYLLLNHHSKFCILWVLKKILAGCILSVSTQMWTVKNIYSL